MPFLSIAPSLSLQERHHLTEIYGRGMPGKLFPFYSFTPGHFPFHEAKWNKAYMKNFLLGVVLTEWPEEIFLYVFRTCQKMEVFCMQHFPWSFKTYSARLNLLKWHITAEQHLPDQILINMLYPKHTNIK